MPENSGWKAMESQNTGRRRRWALFGLLFVLGLAGAAGAFVRWPLWVFSTLTKARLAASGIHGHSLELEGLTVHYLEGGTGAPVVFVHGLASRAQDWAPLLPDVVQVGFHVYAMDLPGFGESAKPSERSYSIREQAAFVEAFLGAVHLDRVRLVGISMGGWIAATVALGAPERVERLALLDSAGFSYHPSFDTGLFPPTTPDQVDALLALLIPHPDRLPGFVKDDIVRNGQQGAWVVHRALASMGKGEAILDSRFSALKMPVLLVWGKQDLITPLALGEAMHRAAPQSVLEVYDGCGHLAVATCATRVVPRLVRFLKGEGAPAGTTVDLPAQ
jgi:pimeloyl-ACP methyl ester carboxylesterase